MKPPDCYAFGGVFFSGLDDVFQACFLFRFSASGAVHFLKSLCRCKKIFLAALLYGAFMIYSSEAFCSLPGTVAARNAGGVKVRRVLGIDPGLANTGFGVIDCCMNKYRMVSYGVIETSGGSTLGERLKVVYSRIQAVIDEFKPEEACMEGLFFARNVTSAINVAEAKGVVTLCLAQNSVPLKEYKPNQIKKAVTGTAAADKELVQKYVQILLNLESRPKPDHAADALACAICHLHYV